MGVSDYLVADNAILKDKLEILNKELSGFKVENAELKYWLGRMICRSNIACMAIRGLGTIPVSKVYLEQLYDLQCQVEDYLRGINESR